MKGQMKQLADYIGNTLHGLYPNLTLGSCHYYDTGDVYGYDCNILVDGEDKDGFDFYLDYGNGRSLDIAVYDCNVAKWMLQQSWSKMTTISVWLNHDELTPEVSRLLRAHRSERVEYAKQLKIKHC